MTPLANGGISGRRGTVKACVLKQLDPSYFAALVRLFLISPKPQVLTGSSAVSYAILGNSRGACAQQPPPSTTKLTKLYDEVEWIVCDRSGGVVGPQRLSQT
jgi:hypothetical protein